MASTDRPVWLLDVDGVLNANRPGWGAAPQSAMAYADTTGWRIRWAPKLLARIRALHASGTVEIRWATTWCPWAGQLERLFRLPDLGRAFTDPLFGDAASLAKRAAAFAVLEGGRPLIWTDDDEVPTGGALHRKLTGAGPALLIRPDARRGLQPDDMDAVELFVQEHSRTGVPG